MAYYKDVRTGIKKRFLGDRYNLLAELGSCLPVMRSIWKRTGVLISAEITAGVYQEFQEEPVTPPKIYSAWNFFLVGEGNGRKDKTWACDAWICKEVAGSSRRRGIGAMQWWVGVLITYCMYVACTADEAIGSSP